MEKPHGSAAKGGTANVALSLATRFCLPRSLGGRHRSAEFCDAPHSKNFLVNIALFTGSAGLIGSETCGRFHAGGLDGSNVSNVAGAPEMGVDGLVYPHGREGILREIFAAGAGWAG